MKIEKMKLLIHRYSTVERLFFPAIAVRRFIAQRRQKQYWEVYQHLCDLLIDDPVIHLDGFQGVFAVGVRSDLFRRLLLKRSYEQAQARCCATYVDGNRDVIDVGANVGFYTVLLGKLLNKGKVLAIEPTSDALRRLYRNIQLNHMAEKTIVFEGAVSNRIGTTEIRVVEGKEEYTSIGELSHPSVVKEKYRIEIVNTITIDELVKRYSLDPGFMKVDAEGVEHLVFEGAHTVLEKTRPVILSELYEPMLHANGSSCSEVVQFLESYDYVVIDPSHPGAAAGKKSYEILCIPREKSS